MTRVHEVRADIVGGKGRHVQRPEEEGECIGLAWYGKLKTTSHLPEVNLAFGGGHERKKADPGGSISFNKSLTCMRRDKSG
jgi:hypothetical protein